MSTIADILGSMEWASKLKTNHTTPPADDAEMVRLARVAMSESVGSPVTQDWQSAALKVCEAVLRRYG